MIRVFVSGEPEEMSIVELQGKLTVPDELVPSTKEELERRRERTADDPADLVSIGFIDKHEHFPSRRTLRMGTLRVEGSAREDRKPVLVLRERSPERDTCSAKDPTPPEVQNASPSSSALCPLKEVEELYETLVNSEPETELFSDWIERHPEMLELETHFGIEALPPGSTAVPDIGKKRERDEAEGLRIKDYEAIGIVKEHLIFNSKPSRVFR